MAHQIPRRRGHRRDGFRRAASAPASPRRPAPRTARRPSPPRRRTLQGRAPGRPRAGCRRRPPRSPTGPPPATPPSRPADTEQGERSRDRWRRPRPSHSAIHGPRAHSRASTSRPRTLPVRAPHCCIAFCGAGMHQEQPVRCLHRGPVDRPEQQLDCGRGVGHRPERLGVAPHHVVTGASDRLESVGRRRGTARHPERREQSLDAGRDLVRRLDDEAVVEGGVGPDARAQAVTTSM